MVDHKDVFPCWLIAEGSTATAGVCGGSGGRGRRGAASAMEVEGDGGAPKRPTGECAGVRYQIERTRLLLSQSFFPCWPPRVSAAIAGGGGGGGSRGGGKCRGRGRCFVCGGWCMLRGCCSC